MARPRLLDLFCGAGGAAMGYHWAGFDVVGVDINPQPHYPFEFVQAGALTVLDDFSQRDWQVDAIHASPPCQDYSAAMRHLSGDYPRLIQPVRDRLLAIGLPWVIENVPGAPLPVQDDLFGNHGVLLCGSMFGLEMAGLQIRRHRLFEASFPVTPPRGCDHSRPSFNPHNGQARGRPLIYATIGRRDPERPWLATMGVGWMDRYEGREAIPPAYTEYIGRQLLAVAGTSITVAYRDVSAIYPATAPGSLLCGRGTRTIGHTGHVQFTIAEACDVLHPPISQRRLRALVAQLPGLRPCGQRRDGTPGRPAPVYQWEDLARLHAAITPWLDAK